MLRGFSFYFLVCFLIGAPTALASICENDYARLDSEFEGARMSDCVAKKNRFIVYIAPENEPINPSPWYAFRVTPKQSANLKITMRYKTSAHRYRPKRSEDGEHWKVIDDNNIRLRRKGKKVTLKLRMEKSPFFVSAQEFLLTDDYHEWTEKIVGTGAFRSQLIGKSVEGRPLVAIFSDPELQLEKKKKEYVLLVGRQHPPEVTGALAMLPFLETVFSNSPLAEKFRNRFHLIAVPLMNPDGVVHGHWRHNMNGVDLNRDWGPFTQPETQAVERILDTIANDKDSELRLMMDFHSTKRNVFYTQFKNVETIPPKFTAQWIEGAQERLNGYEFERAERETTDLATSKNYIHRRFGAPAITYELGDQTERETIRASAIVFAEEMMEVLLASDETLADKVDR